MCYVMSELEAPVLSFCGERNERDCKTAIDFNLVIGFDDEQIWQPF